MTNPLSPVVTENEMRSFADRMVTMVVSHSEQARELGDLQTRFNDLDIRVREFTTRNEALRNQVDILVSERDQLRSRNDSMAKEVSDLYELQNETETKLKSAQQSADSWKASYDSTCRDLSEANNRNHELGNKLGQIEAELNQARQAAAEREQTNNWLNSRLKDATADRDATVERLRQSEYELKATRDALATVQGALGKLQDVLNPAPKPQGDQNAISQAQPEPDWKSVHNPVA